MMKLTMARVPPELMKLAEASHDWITALHKSSGNSLLSATKDFGLFQRS
jgi:hypothetical protein